MLRGKTIVLGVTGGIAAYKAAALCSRLAQSGAEVHVIMTRSAVQFIAPLTFQTLSRNPVAVDTFEEKNAAVVNHIDLADKADLVVIAPATANMMAKLAHGMADDMLSTTLLATEAPVLVAPAMNVHMYAHPATQDNMATLRKRGVSFVEPGTGQLACGYVGKGRLAEPEQIYEEIVRKLAGAKPLAGKRVLVTAGGTIERIDPVRYITNDSSGKMGIAIAESARDLGAEVTLIRARTSVADPSGVAVIEALSSGNMYEEVMSRLDTCDVIVMTAAVADYRPAEAAQQKIKKSGETLRLELVKTKDILQTIGERKTSQLVIGFAAETEKLEQYALEKLRRKRCDLLVANDVSKQNSGFGADNNEVRIYDAEGLVAEWPSLPKTEVAHRIMELAVERMAAKTSTGSIGYGGDEA
jgi:phosphopantothenoylcysteine decarboxylase / phosphopantothenate---cysteine ligase